MKPIPHASEQQRRQVRNCAYPILKIKDKKSHVFDIFTANNGGLRYNWMHINKCINVARGGGFLIYDPNQNSLVGH